MAVVFHENPVFSYVTDVTDFGPLVAVPFWMPPGSPPLWYRLSWVTLWHVWCVLLDFSCGDSCFSWLVLWFLYTGWWHCKYCSKKSTSRRRSPSFRRGLTAQLFLSRFQVLSVPPALMLHFRSCRPLAL